MAKLFCYGRRDDDGFVINFFLFECLKREMFSIFLYFVFFEGYNNKKKYIK